MRYPATLSVSFATAQLVTLVPQDVALTTFVSFKATTQIRHLAFLFRVSPLRKMQNRDIINISFHFVHVVKSKRLTFEIII